MYLSSPPKELLDVQDCDAQCPLVQSMTNTLYELFASGLVVSMTLAPAALELAFHYLL